MSRTTGQTAVDGGFHVLPTRAVPPVELPAPSEHLAARAAELLGWSGIMLPPMTLLGRKVIVVAELLTAEHAERVCLGAPPVTDRTTVSTWVWPEMAGRVPPAAVRIVGVIAVSRHWRSALTSAVPFARFTNAAVVVPSTVAGADDFLLNCLMRARQYGVAVATADERDGVELAMPARAEQPAVDLQESMIRWMHEMVYEQLLATVPA
ncbi:hypothetical protein [Allokutzneria oryzae]|uniref:Uncharacterized protein n=1 Tax=Allokutzneria oryzae TaxID=1378989 RepID=A0ABV6A081_9PSEU